MVHPSELLRTNSNEGRQFSAPTNILSENPIDCGLTNLPCINNWFNLEKFAKPKVFLVFLSLVGFFQGVTVSYFRGTSQIWASHYNIPLENIDWIIYANEFFAGLLALIISYWGNRIHRISYIGGLTIFQAISAVVLIIPEIYRKNYQNPEPVLNLCTLSMLNSPQPVDKDTNYVALVVLGIYQMFFATATISFICHGITYLHDNTSPNHSPAYIAISLAAKELGKQAGIYCTGIPYFFSNDSIFLSAVWLLITILTFCAGTLIAMFPKNLPSALMERVAASILDLASGHDVPRKKQIADGFCKIILRLLKNPVLIINILSMVLLQSAVINFNIFEKYFNQSRFNISYNIDSSLMQLATNLLQQPLVSISIIATGMVIAKINPHLKSLAKWNIIVLVFVIIFFGSTAFLKCPHDLDTEYKDLIANSQCNSHCTCSSTAFQPICIKSKTLYSPCMAGCSSIKEINFNKVYQNCTCDGTHWYTEGHYEGTEGSCNTNNCNIYWTISQANRVMFTALIASTLVTNLIINMKCVFLKDKALALGLETTLLGIVPYLPVRVIYEAISKHFCNYRFGEVCNLYSDGLGLFLSISTISLMNLSLVFSIVLFFILKSRPIDKIEEDADSENVEELEEMRNGVPTAASALINNYNNDDIENIDLRLDSRVSSDKRTISENSVLTTDSLRELENVGDDHDSVDSGHFKHSRDGLNRSSFFESEF